MRKCIECDADLSGRAGQKYCSDNCKSAFHYKNNKQKLPSTYVRIEKQLKQNRSILKKYNLSGQLQIRKDILPKEGFDFKYYTHLWIAENRDVYCFCYEYGFCDLKDGNYKLTMWQDHMK